MSKRIKLGGLVAAGAVVAAIGAVAAIGSGSQVPGKNGVYSSDIAKGEVKSNDLEQPKWAGVTLKNGWVPYGNGTRPPKVAVDGFGFIHLRGAIKRTSGSSDVPFTLAGKYRPSVAVFVTVPIDPNTNAQLQVLSNGEATIQHAGGSPQILTSLEGVSFHK